MTTTDEKPISIAQSIQADQEPLSFQERLAASKAEAKAGPNPHGETAL